MNTERIIKENRYIEGLCAALSAVQKISPELVVDLEQDLDDALMESEGLFAAIRTLAVQGNQPVSYDLFIMQNEKGECFFPIFTNPEYLKDYLASINFQEEDAPFCMVQFEQIVGMLQTFAGDNNLKCPGIILNCGREEELLCPMEAIRKSVREYHKTHDNLTDEECKKRRVLWCMDESPEKEK